MERDRFDEVKEDFRNALSPLYLEVQAIRQDLQDLKDMMNDVINLQ